MLLEDRIGRVAYYIPNLGYTRAGLSSRAGRARALEGLALLVGLVIVELWRPSRAQPHCALSGTAAE